MPKPKKENLLASTVLQLKPNKEYLLIVDLRYTSREMAEKLADRLDEEGIKGITGAIENSLGLKIVEHDNLDINLRLNCLERIVKASLDPKQPVILTKELETIK